MPSNSCGLEAVPFNTRPPWPRKRVRRFVARRVGVRFGRTCPLGWCNAVPMGVRAQGYTFEAEDIDFVTSSLRDLLEGNQFLTLGRFVEQFETEFAARHDGGFAVATNSGTSALEAILRSLDVAGGDVIVPTNTFAATAFAVVRAGARPVFADCGPDMTIDPADAASRITPRTRAVITVHIGGLISPGTLQLVDACALAGVPLVEDAAHAHGSALGGRSAGTFGVASAFSFFSTKVITTGEGGMVLTRDERIRDCVRLLRDQAKVAGANLHEAVGANWRLTEAQAILGIAQLRRLDQFIERRQEIAELYRTQLEGLDGVTMLPVPAGAHHNFYKLIVLLDSMEPATLAERLKSRYQVALGGTVYDVPLHHQPVFREYSGGPLPVAEDLCRRHVCPPIYPSLTDDDVDLVVTGIRECVSEYVS